MGVVAKCTHLGLNEQFAVKMLRQDVMLDHDATERFTREAQSASKLKSEHVARVVDVGTFETGVPYMVMEFLDGHDLGELVDERGPLQAPFASMLMLQAAEALGEAHSIGIVHRDVKPSNLFVTWRPDGSALVKVLDFGISKAPNGSDMKLTQTQSLLGTPAYMSPEQMRSARLVDLRTDIWSLGTVFYELLEGRRPFEAESFSEMCVKVAVDPPEPMVNTPPALQQIILRCLAKNPDQRYATMAELGRDLLPHVQDVHQASLLVERMQRMLGRAARSSATAADQWEGVSTGTGRSTPLPIRDVGSAPVAQAWSGGSDPLGTSMPTPSPFSRIERTPDPRAPVSTLREDSRPARALSEVIAIQQAPAKRRGKWIVLVALLTIGAGIGALLALNTGDGDNATPSGIGTPALATQPATPGNDKPASDKPAGDKSVAKPTIGSDAPKVGATVGSNAGGDDAIEIPAKPDVAVPDVAVNPPVIKSTAIKPPPGKPPAKPSVSKPPVKPIKPSVVAKQPEKPPPVETKPATKPATSGCAVYERLPSGACPKKP